MAWNVWRGTDNCEARGIAKVEDGLQCVFAIVFTCVTWQSIRLAFVDFCDWVLLLLLEWFSAAV